MFHLKFPLTIRRSLFIVVCLVFATAGFVARQSFVAHAQRSSDAPQTAKNQQAAKLERRFDNVTGVRIKNSRGRVEVKANDAEEKSLTLEAISYARKSESNAFDEKQLFIEAREGDIVIEVAGDEAADNQANNSISTNRNVARIDLVLRVPSRAKVAVETTDGAVDVTGDFADVNVKTTTGTISADVPISDLRYNFQWTASRPRIYSAVELESAKERAAGRFEIEGRLGANAKKKKGKTSSPDNDTTNDVEIDEASDDTGDDADEDKAAQTEEAKRAARREREQAKKLERTKRKNQIVKLDLTTARGVVLFGVDPASAPADLQPRKLTQSARAIIQFGDEELIERIRRLAPQLVDEYAGTLPFRTRPPQLSVSARDAKIVIAERAANVTVAVTDTQGRAVKNLTAEDFTLSENGAPRRITNVKAGDAPFNLVLLLDTSGSVEERLEFIRRAALAFVNTADARDRIAIVSFRDDVQQVSDFTNDKNLLRLSINNIEAGGGTALYDAVAYTLLETLKPRAADERTAIVILSDGDDNRSFLSFANVNRLAREAGAVIYPIYIPSGLLGNDAFAAQIDSAPALDPTRNRYLTLTTRATEEGFTLAQTSGGIFHTVTRFGELQQAYNDTLAQLRNSYTLTYTTTNAASRPRVQLKSGALVKQSRK